MMNELTDACTRPVFLDQSHPRLTPSVHSWHLPFPINQKGEKHHLSCCYLFIAWTCRKSFLFTTTTIRWLTFKTSRPLVCFPLTPAPQGREPWWNYRAKNGKFSSVQLIHEKLFLWLKALFQWKQTRPFKVWDSEASALWLFSPTRTHLKKSPVLPIWKAGHRGSLLLLLF